MQKRGLNGLAITNRPYTSKLDNLSKQPVTEVINKVLKHDAKKAFDIQGHAQFNATPLRFVGTATDAGDLTTDGTATATNSNPFTKDHAKVIVDTMKERDIPPYAMDDYFAISHPTTLRTFKNDLEGIHQYTDPGLQLIMNGEVGRYESTRYIEQTFIPKGGAADTTTFDPNTGTSDAWSFDLSSWIFFFGEDTCAEALAIPEEVRGKIPSDYGRSKGVAWYYLGGFGIIHTAQLQARIVKWDSAA